MAVDLGETLFLLPPDIRFVVRDDEPEFRYDYATQTLYQRVDQFMDQHKVVIAWHISMPKESESGR